jgi:hypothetical protein
MTITKWFAVACLVLAAGCTTNPSSVSNSTVLSQYDGSYTLQGKVMSATDGSPVTTGLTMNLVQGTTIRTDYTFQTTGILAGNYAFSNIPLPLACGDITYELVVSAPGFAPFQSDLSYCVSEDNRYNDTEIDSTYNFMGNIYLFPLGATAPSYSFDVTYQGAPVPNATVLLDPVDSTTYADQSEDDEVLYNDLSTTASLSATTNSAGSVTFAGTTLALGTAYQVQVLPVQFTPTGGTAISLAGCGANSSCSGVSYVQVGFPGSPVNQNIALSGLAQPLLIASDSAQLQGQLTPSGQLVITFNMPVTLTGTFAAAGVNTASVLTPMTATLSNGGLTLTLAPAAGTITCTDTTQACGVMYSDNTAAVSPVEYPAETFEVFSGLRLVNNSAPAATVYMVGP